MHELGIVFHILKEAEDVARANNVREISAVVLDIGEVSGIVNDYLVDCWDWAKKKTDALKDAELKINVIHAKTFCENCKKEYVTVRFGKVCPYCKSESTYLITGNETIIKEIHAKN